MSLRSEHRAIRFASSPATAVAGTASASASEHVRGTVGRSGRGRLPVPGEVIVAIIFLGILFLTYGSVWKNAPLVEPDTPSYQQLAREIKQGTLSQLSLRTPGLPLLLLLTASETTPTRSFYLVSLAMHLASIGMLAFLLRYFRISKRLIALFMLLAALPPFVETAAYMTSETLSEFLVVLTCVSLAGWLITKRAAFMIVFGLAATYAAFTRPTFQALTAIIWVGLFACYGFGYLRHISLRSLVISAATTILFSFGAQGAYAAFNYERFGYLGMSGLPPYSLSTKVAGVLEDAPVRDAEVRDILIRHRDQLLVDPNYDHTGQNYIFRAMPDLVTYYGGDQKRALKKVQELSIYLIKARPMSYIVECLKATAVYWMPTDGSLSGARSKTRRAVWALVQFAIIGLFFLQFLALAGHAMHKLPVYAAAPRVKRLMDEFGSGLLIPLYVTGSAVIWCTMAISCLLAIGLARYRVPTDLLIIAVTILGFEIWKKNLLGPTLSDRSGIPATRLCRGSQS